jgi:hypothetical protein
MMLDVSRLNAAGGLSVDLDEGHAEHMGDGGFLLFLQDDEGVVRRVYLSAADLEALLVAA